MSSDLIVEMGADGSVEVIQFAFVRESHFENVRAEAADEVGSDRTARVADGVDHCASLDADV
jgi:hypothetical protein